MDFKLFKCMDEMDKLILNTYFKDKNYGLTNWKMKQNIHFN